MGGGGVKGLQKIFPPFSRAKYAKKSSRRCATTFGSSVRIVPAAALRGFANFESCTFSRSAFIRANDASGIMISPRTSKSDGKPAFFSTLGAIDNGTDRTVRMFEV